MVDVHTIKLSILVKLESILFDAISILNTATLIQDYEEEEDAKAYEAQLRGFGIWGARKAMEKTGLTLADQLEKIQTKIKNPKQYQKAIINLDGSNVAFNPQVVLPESEMIPRGFYTATVPSRVSKAPSPKRKLKAAEKSPPKVSKYLQNKIDELCSTYHLLSSHAFWAEKRYRQALSRNDDVEAAKVKKEKLKVLEEMGRLAKYCKKSAERSPIKHGNASPNISIASLQKKSNLTEQEKQLLQKRLQQRNIELEKLEKSLYPKRRALEKALPSYIPISEKTFIKNPMKPSPSGYYNMIGDEEIEFLPKPWSAPGKYIRNPNYEKPAMLKGFRQPTPQKSKSPQRKSKSKSKSPQRKSRSKSKSPF
jgi:hypothetical protein